MEIEAPCRAIYLSIDIHEEATIKRGAAGMNDRGWRTIKIINHRWKDIEGKLI